MPRAAFSADGRYYADVCDDGKLRIWHVSSSFLHQEYTPDAHLTYPLTCLTWIVASKLSSKSKKRKLSETEDEPESDYLLVGTRSGKVLIYSISSGSVIEALEGGHSNVINSIAWSKDTRDKLYTCSDDQHIAEWDLSDKSVIRRWKCGRVSCIAVSQDSSSVVSAKKEIKWWNISGIEPTVEKTFIGHSTDVCTLTFVRILGTDYVLSAAKSDRVIHAWALSDTAERQAVATFNMDDYSVSLSARAVLSNTVNILACSKTGCMHFYQCVLNGNAKKPVKPKITVQIALETTDNKSDAEQIPIINGMLCEDTCCYIAYGEDVILSFEKMNLETDQTNMFLVRQDPKKKLLAQKEYASTKLMPTGKNKHVQYIHNDTVNGLIPNTSEKKHQKRPLEDTGKPVDVPLELRLENLSVGDVSATVTQPASESLTHLLLQGLRSKDKHIMQDVLINKDESVIKTTLARLPVEAVIPLITELVSLLRGKPAECDTAIRWLKQVVSMHAAHLISSPEIMNVFNSVFPIVESKLNALSLLYKLSGRLDLMIEQIEDQTNNTTRMLQNINFQPKLVYQDDDTEESSSSSSEMLNNEKSSSESDEDEKWDEISEIDDDDDDEDEDEMEDVIPNNIFHNT